MTDWHEKYLSLEQQIKRDDLREWMQEKNALVRRLEDENLFLKGLVRGIHDATSTWVEKDDG